MSAPVIDTITGWLAWPLGIGYDYQLNATNTPTSWAVTGLPTGLSVTSGGQLHGIATVPGVYNCRATATNGSGSSTEMLFTLGVEEADDAFSMAIPMDLDLDTGVLTGPGVGDATASGAIKPELFLKPGNPVMIALAIKRGGIYLTPAVIEFEVALKSAETEALNMESTVVPLAVGSTVTRRWQFPVTLDDVPAGGSAITGALSDVEDDAGTQLTALFEVTVRWTDDVDGDGTTEIYERTSKNCPVLVQRRLSVG